MNKAVTFARGGVAPVDFRSLTSHFPVTNAPVPAVAVVPLLQHAGAEAMAVVSPGDTVREGMLVARADGFFSAHVHSPVPGVVRGFASMTLPDGRRCRAITIECAGEFDRSGKILDDHSWDGLDAGALNALVAEAGVVGLGGTGVPVHAKYAPRGGRCVSRLIVNGAEVEPYLTGGLRLMLEKPAELLEGARIAAKISGAREVIIAVAENMPDAIEVLGEIIAEKRLPFTLITVKAKYPQGDENLLRRVVGRALPPAGDVAGAVAVVSHVGTVFAVYEAVVRRKPLIERVVTVTGSAVVRPSNVKARIGTRIRELFEDCGGFTEPPGRIVMGGPFLGSAVADLDASLTKLTTGIIALRRREAAVYPDRPCIRCGRCVRACPWGLSPTTLVKLLRGGRTEQALAEGLSDCVECGCCAYVCPARIPLAEHLKRGKGGAVESARVE